jgi:LmbE family N-acetylglucosaminyl deacetylase
MQHDIFQPTFVVDVTAVWEAKVESLRAYRSQLHGGALTAKAADGPITKVSTPEFWLSVEGRARHFGEPIGAALAEPFWSRVPLAVADPMAILPGGVR